MTEITKISPIDRKRLFLHGILIFDCKSDERQNKWSTKNLLCFSMCICSTETFVYAVLL